MAYGQWRPMLSMWEFVTNAQKVFSTTAQNQNRDKFVGKANEKELQEFFQDTTNGKSHSNVSAIRTCLNISIYLLQVFRHDRMSGIELQLLF